MPSSYTKPKDPRALIAAVGQDLVRRRGKQSYYAVIDVHKSVRAAGYPSDMSCWALAVYASPLDFKSYSETLGEACDYFDMRSEILPYLADSKRTFSLPDFDWSSLPDIDLSWLEWQEFFTGEFLNPFQWFDGV